MTAEVEEVEETAEDLKRSNWKVNHISTKNPLFSIELKSQLRKILHIYA